MDSVQISPFILTAIIVAAKVFIPSKVVYTPFALAKIQKLAFFSNPKKPLAKPSAFTRYPDTLNEQMFLHLDNFQ